MRRGFELRSGAQRGFTLLEMMIALGIAAAAGIALMGWSQSRSSAFSVEVFSRKLQAELRRARAAAIAANAETIVLFNRRERRFETSTGAILIPEGVIVEVTAADAERADEHTIGIRFFPTGKSTGGVITISRQMGVAPAETIAVNWLTGQVAGRQETRR
jgi:general secretion pathway protein H